MNTTTTAVGFIGLGVMGKSMAERLMAVYPDMHVYSRRKISAESLLARGAVWHSTPAELAAVCPVIFTMVGYPYDVEEVYLGDHGIIKNAAAGTLCVDMTTSSPQLAEKIYTFAKTKHIAVLDAPVSGGDSGAKNGTLSIMCGGDKAAFEAAEPYFRCMGKTWTLQGGAGCGQHTKAANQIAVAANLIGAVEALRYAESVKLDPHQVLAAIGGGAAGSWQLSNNAPKMLEGDFQPGFFVKHFLKDLTIALEAADSIGLSLPLLRLAQEFFDCMNKADYTNLGTQALYDYYRRFP